MGLSSDYFVGNWWLYGELAIHSALVAVIFLACTADSTNKSLLQWRASLLKLIFAHKLYSTDDRKLFPKPQLSLIRVLKLSKICWLPSSTIIPRITSDITTQHGQSALQLSQINVCSHYVPCQCMLYTWTILHVCKPAQLPFTFSCSPSQLLCTIPVACLCTARNAIL